MSIASRVCPRHSGRSRQVSRKRARAAFSSRIFLSFFSASRREWLLQNSVWMDIFSEYAIKRLPRVSHLVAQASGGSRILVLGGTGAGETGMGGTGEAATFDGAVGMAATVEGLRGLASGLLAGGDLGVRGDGDCGLLESGLGPLGELQRLDGLEELLRMPWPTGGEEDSIPASMLSSLRTAAAGRASSVGMPAPPGLEVRESLPPSLRLFFPMQFSMPVRSASFSRRMSSMLAKIVATSSSGATPLLRIGWSTNSTNASRTDTNFLSVIRSSVITLSRFRALLSSSSSLALSQLATLVAMSAAAELAAGSGPAGLEAWRAGLGPLEERLVKLSVFFLI
mmetsp:Transcript_17016/g.66323  ORF Transcript_17016/g.66323 Transcript_17016/m.66323 type:complete len:339 (-) Transcript_17016:254-1270(-)